MAKVDEMTLQVQRLEQEKKEMRESSRIVHLMLENDKLRKDLEFYKNLASKGGKPVPAPPSEQTKKSHQTANQWIQDAHQERKTKSPPTPNTLQTQTQTINTPSPQTQPQPQSQSQTQPQPDAKSTPPVNKKTLSISQFLDQVECTVTCEKERQERQERQERHDKQERHNKDEKPEQKKLIEFSSDESDQEQIPVGQLIIDPSKLQVHKSSDESDQGFFRTTSQPTDRGKGEIQERQERQERQDKESQEMQEGQERQEKEEKQKQQQQQPRDQEVLATLAPSVHEVNESIHQEQVEESEEEIEYTIEKIKGVKYFVGSDKVIYSYISKAEIGDPIGRLHVSKSGKRSIKPIE
jgi:hypothetical protein